MRLYVICCISIVIFYSLNINYYNCVIHDYNVNDVFVIDEVYENYGIVKGSDNKYLIYFNDNEFKEGNKIHFKGNLVSIKDTYNDFYNYLNKKNVWYELDYNKFELLDESVRLNVELTDNFLNKKNEKSKSYLKLILFNQKDEYNKEFYNNFSLYSLTYLIAVSGFHINLLLSFFKKLFHNNVIGIMVVSFYLYLLDFSVSSYRAFMCYIFKYVNGKLGFSLSNLEVISLIGCVFIFFNPCIMFSFSFIFSFLSTMVLEIFKLYKENKIKIALYIYLINLPILLFNYYKINVFSIAFGVILSFPVSFLYVFSFIFLFLDKFYLLYEIVIRLFYGVFDILNEFNIILVFGKPSVVFVIVYYLLLVNFFILKECKRKSRFGCGILIFVLITYQYCKPLLNSNEEFYFLNVGQGDCSVFFIPNSKEVVLVDTGGSKYKDVATREIIPFLESKGINKIRSIVLTHDDFDHAGALSSLKDNFEVAEVIETSLVEEVVIGSKKFKNLNISERRDNEGSVVLYGKYGGYKLLLMGDASIEIEEKILDMIDNVDVIKIGHHGSNTSSGYNFLESINGRVAIISVGKNNIYGHPHDEVLNRLGELGYVVFRTDENNDIGFGKNIFGLSFIDYFK